METPQRGTRSWTERVRVGVGAAVTDAVFHGALTAVGKTRLGDAARVGVEVERDVAYLDTGLAEHRLDVYRPKGVTGKLPVMLYVHGGGFRILSKETHWVFGQQFARRGFLVVNLNYRLSPAHPFPAGLMDVCAAFRWLVANAERLGGDLGQLVFGGESAGANLVTALALATCSRRAEPFAREVFELGVVPKAVVAAYGLLQVTEPERFTHPWPLATYFTDRMVEMTEAYLGGVDRTACPVELADPLLVLERGEATERPLPPFFAPCGAWDFLVDDSRRLEAALGRLGVECDAQTYPQSAHGFHFAWFTPAGRACWRDLDGFLGRHLPARAARES